MRAQLAAYAEDAVQTLRLERDPRGRLGSDTWLVNRYALIFDDEGEQYREIPLFVRCEAIVASEMAAATVLETLIKDLK